MERFTPKRKLTNISYHQIVGRGKPMLKNNIVNGFVNEKLPELDGRDMTSQHGKINWLKTDGNKPSRSLVIRDESIS